MRRHKILKKHYDKVVAYVKGVIADAEDEKQAEPAEQQMHAVPEGTLPKVGWAKHGPFRLKKTKHGRDTLFVAENGALKELVHEGRVDEYLRDAMLLPSSDVPLARDAGYHIVQKRTVGISRRMMQRFINKQEVRQLTRPQNKSMQNPGTTAKGRGYLEIDLIEAKGADIGKYVHRPVRNFYFISMIDRLTGWLEIGRVTTKDLKTVAPKLRSMLETMRLALGIARIHYIRSDKGSEFKKDTQELFKELHIRHKFVSSGNRIENANRIFQRIWYQLLRLGRGDVGPLTNQAVGIFNNTKSRINGYTPLEALRRPDAELKEAFTNLDRERRVARYKAEPIVQGDKVRYLIEKVVGKHKKALAYKSYRGLHWSPEVYDVVKINTTTGKFYVGGEYRFRDKLLKVPGVDAETKRRSAAMHKATKDAKRQQFAALGIGDLVL